MVGVDRIPVLLGSLDHVQVMLNHDDRVPGIHQLVKDIQQLLDVNEVQARGGFIQEFSDFLLVPARINLLWLPAC